MIFIKTEEEIEIMRQGGKILAKIARELEKAVKPGVTTEYLNKVAEDLVFKCGAEPSFKGYDNFPAVVCTSINEEVVHWPPSVRKLKQGDTIVLDLGIKYKGFHTDMAITVALDKADPEALRLMKATKYALDIGIKQAVIENTFGDIGNAVQKYVESQGFTIVKELCGHGIGRELHEDPDIPNYGKKGTGFKIKQGMVFCIEPITSTGGWEIEKDKKTGGYRTKDGSLSAHFEHTVAITKNGPEILTNL